MPKQKNKSAAREKWYHRIFDIPEQISSRVPFLELNNDRELFIGGYERLLCYEDGCVILLLYDGRALRIDGNGFSLRIVREGTLAVSGVVTQITFLAQKKDGSENFLEGENDGTNFKQSFSKRDAFAISNEANSFPVGQGISTNERNQGDKRSTEGSAI